MYPGAARPCPRCGGEGFFTPEKLAALAAGLPAAASLAAEGVRQARLDVCEKCDALRENVLCAYCGCFVLFRARPARSYCPHPHAGVFSREFCGIHDVLLSLIENVSNALPYRGYQNLFGGNK